MHPNNGNCKNTHPSLIFWKLPQDFEKCLCTHLPNPILFTLLSFFFLICFSSLMCSSFFLLYSSFFILQSSFFFLHFSYCFIFHFYLHYLYSLKKMSLDQATRSQKINLMLTVSCSGLFISKCSENVWISLLWKIARPLLSHLPVGRASATAAPCYTTGPISCVRILPYGWEALPIWPSFIVGSCGLVIWQGPAM